MGMATDINTAMIAITIINSISVKPKRPFIRTGAVMASSPFRVWSTIVRLIRTLGVNIENILPTPGQSLGIVARAAYSPLLGIGHGIFRNAPQIFDFLVHRAHGLHAFHQLLQGLGIVVGIYLGRADLSGIHIVFELVDSFPDIVQSVLQIAFLIALHFVAR